MTGKKERLKEFGAAERGATNAKGGWPRPVGRSQWVTERQVNFESP